MKKHISFLFLLLFTTTTFAQNCEIEKEETDKFTQTTNKTTKPRLIAEDLKFDAVGLKIKTVSLKGLSLDGKKGLYIMLLLKEGGLQMGYGATMTLLLDNKTTIQMTATGMIDDFIEEKGKIYQGRNFFMSNEDYEKVILHMVTDIRIKAQMNGFDLSINPEHQIAIRELMNCVK